MKCPSQTRLAAASLGEDPRVALHAETCERCSAELAAMMELRTFARRAPVRFASSDRRARIAALVMASADAAEPVRRSHLPLVGVVLVGIAAISALVFWRPQPRSAEHAIAWPVVPMASPQVSPAVTPSPFRHTAASPAVATTAPAIPTGAAHAVVPESPRPTTRSFAGSEERARAGDVARDQFALEPHAVIARVIEPSPFEIGWTALRGSRYADAIAAFDRATDPAVAEDAAYWAAIASARAGDRSDAAHRLTTFVTKFPTSPRLVDARALLARLAR